MNAREKECLASKYHFVCTPKLFIAVKKQEILASSFVFFLKFYFLKLSRLF